MLLSLHLIKLLQSAYFLLLLNCFLSVLLLSPLPLLRGQRYKWRCLCLSRILAVAWLWRTGLRFLALLQLAVFVACSDRKRIWFSCACRRLLAVVLEASAVLVARCCVGLAA